MSIAGIRSNRGDFYQKLVAFEWALTVLTNPDYEWLETDSTTYSVDDIVIGKFDGSVICCQCKKNHTDFKSWSIADLSDELEKAIKELDLNPNVLIRFYSRDSFGSLAKLREFSASFPDEDQYKKNLTIEHIKTDDVLEALIKGQGSNLSTFEFLSRTTFEVTYDFDRFDEKLHEHLCQIVTNSEKAYNAIWNHLDRLSGRFNGDSQVLSANHRLTKDDLKDIIQEAGAILAPTISLSTARQSFLKTSAIGRSWIRDIAGEKITNSVLEKLLEAIDDESRSVLLTGAPGSGKTCVMLSLQEELEKRTNKQANLIPLFIQSREFADLATVSERQAQGLSEKWVEQAARLAENTKVIVVIDSLDVLSIAREHSVLTYFLAQIDQLLRIPNVTVITACRDFDKKYDRRIASRKWDLELECGPLDWDDQVVPLLEKLEIDSSAIDSVTRKLIRNPRELSLFIDLALNEGSFSVVTSQALAQRYLDKIIEANPALGITAMRAIENIAEEMLTSRSLSVPHQRFDASQEILHRLKSLNVLKDTHNGKLTFGHQTLLDVLVISGAIRKGTSLNEFIKELPPVPFVRPSIRSFVAQLATEDRSIFRKQLRTVLTGNAAFHIRRLVAKAFAQQPPDDGDWPLIRDLRNNHTDVFQVIYTQATLIDWHKFWLTHLIPVLMDSFDEEGIKTHVNLIKQWINNDTKGVVAFWENILSLSWVDKKYIVERIGFYINDINEENLTEARSLLIRLLDFPIPEYGYLGQTVARCVDADIIDDALLWQYMSGDVAEDEDEIRKYDFGKDLNCKPNEFGNKNQDFLKKRMLHSTVLLDLALESIEQWSQKRYNFYYDDEKKREYFHGFLIDTSYDIIHSHSDHRHMNIMGILMGAIENAILDHVKKDTDWWQRNRERITFSREGALCYIAINAITKFPQSNLDLISQLLCNKDLLEFELSYEICLLIQAAFVFLDEKTQNKFLLVVQTVFNHMEADENKRTLIHEERAKYISAVPCHLRSLKTQEILNNYESIFGKVVIEPSIHSWGGAVVPPFSYKVFLDISDDGVIRLLMHYIGYDRRSHDFLVGGQREVGTQLREAASRHPSKFLNILSLYWSTIDTQFRDDIMDGIASHIDYLYGNLNTTNNWDPINKPDANDLVDQIFGELERHYSHWHNNRFAARAIRACSHVIFKSQDVERLVLLAVGFSNLKEEINIKGSSNDLITTGINMISGNVVEALMYITNNLLENDKEIPKILRTSLIQFAGHEHRAIRALMLRHLPYLQSKNLELGWELFEISMQDSVGLWKSAERCLYYLYYDHFEKVAPSLERIYREGNNEDLETWGRISALASLNGQINFDDFIRELNSIGITEAWQGAASVWTHDENIRKYREQCIEGVKVGLKTGNNHALAVAEKFTNIFRETSPPVIIPVDLIQLYFSVYESNTEDKRNQFYGFNEWLNAISQHDPDNTLTAIEIYLTFVSHTIDFFYDYGDHLVQIITRLFAEAEEREEADNGEMLNRVVAVQDLMLSLGLESMDKWLKEAERQ